MYEWVSKGVKKKRQLQQQKRTKAQQVLLKNKPVEEMNDTDLKTLLAWFQIPAKETKNVQERRAKWKHIVDNKIKEPPFELWSAMDERKLEEMKTNDVDIKDTQLERTKEITKSEFQANFKVMTKEERNEMLTQLKTIDEEVTDVAGV